MRWGWELRDLYRFCRPFAQAEPIRRQPVNAGTQEDLHRLQARLAYREQRGYRFVRRVFVAYFLALIPGFILGMLAGGEGAFGGVIFLWIVLLILNPELQLLRWRVQQARRDAEERARTAQERFERDHRAWKQAKAQHDAAERARVEAEYDWYGVVRPEPSPRRVNLYGGTPAGWQALLMTLGSSLLAGGRRLVVLDVSQREVPARLLAAALEEGLPLDEMVLPRDQARLQPFTGLDSDEAAVLLAEALHEADRGDRQGRNLDFRVLQRICRLLAPNLSMVRIAAGLRVLLGEEEPPGEYSSLSAEEYDQLSTLMGSDYRTNARLFERMMCLEADLSQLEQVGTSADRRVLSAAALQFVSLSHRGGTVNELYLELLVQLQLRRLRKAEAGHGLPVLIIAGADRLRERQLREFDSLTAEIGAPLICLFERYGEEQRRSIPSGDGAVGFMSLTDAEDAAAAAAQLGMVERFILSQTGSSRGSNSGQTWSFGQSQGETFTVAPGSDSYNYSTSNEQGRSSGRSQDVSRTLSLQERHEVEPRDLRAAKHTDLYLVMWQRAGRRGAATQDAGQRHVWYADCDPMIALDPRASQQPFALGA
jgi:hypothetical protein